MQDDNIFIEFQNQQKEITYYLGDHMYDETIVLSTVTISQTHRIEESFSTLALLAMEADNPWWRETVLCIIGCLAASLVPIH